MAAKENVCALDTSSRLKSVDEIYRVIVIGFIRSSMMDIPIDIMNICVFFYATIEAFDKELVDNELTLSNCGNIISLNKNYSWNTAVGSFKIDVRSYKNCIIEWIFKVQHSNDFVLQVGIVEHDIKHKKIGTDDIGDCFDMGQGYICYGFHIAALEQYIKHWLTPTTYKENMGTKTFEGMVQMGDDKTNLVKLKFNIIDKSLSLVIVVDGLDKEISTLNDIDMSVTYRIAVAIFKHGTNVELMNFKIGNK